MTNMTQAEYLTAARELLEPNPVERGEYPDWLLKILDEEYGGYPLSSVLHNSRCVDHYGISKGYYCADPDDCFVMEPYGSCIADLVELKRFCDEHKLSYYVSANSWHFPGKTIRIVIYPDS